MAINDVFALAPNTSIGNGNGGFTLDGVAHSTSYRVNVSGKGTTSAKAIQITVAGHGILRFAVSAGGAGRKWVLYKNDGTAYETCPATNTVPTNSLSATVYTVTVLEAGTYFLTSTGSGLYFHYCEFTQFLKDGTVNGFTIDTSGVKKEYFVGDTFASDGLIVKATYSNGMVVPLTDSDYTVDSSAFNSAVAGTYTISVKYSTYDSETYDVVVREVTSIKVLTTPLVNGKKAKYTSKVFKVGQAFSSANIVVKAATSSSEIALASTAYSVSAVDTTAGEKTVTVTFKTFSDSYKVTYIDATALAANASGVYEVAVDPTVSAEGTLVNSLMTFSSIQNAHDFLQASLAATDKKQIDIADGTYNEKLYITMPLLTLTSKSGDASKVIIQSSEDSDSVDASGAAWGTFGSSSTTLTADATGFAASKLTFRNSKFLTMSEYTASSDGNKQAVALVSCADQSRFSDCVFTGFQDTLYSNAGKQYFLNCAISGMTDYIFGESNDVYFKSCTLTCMNRGSDTNGGYICAPRPASLTASDVGYVFSDCTITGETGVTAGTVSLARAWGANAKVTYANCTMDASVSKEAWVSSATRATGSKNPRWEEMSGNVPTAADFAEYNSTGDGAISTEVIGGKILSADAYTSFSATLATAFSWIN